MWFRPFGPGRPPFSVVGGWMFRLYFGLELGPAAFGGGRCFRCFRTGADVSPLQGRASSDCPQGRLRIGYVFKRSKYCCLTDRSYRGLKESLQSVAGSKCTYCRFRMVVNRRNPLQFSVDNSEPDENCAESHTLRSGNPARIVVIQVLIRAGMATSGYYLRSYFLRTCGTLRRRPEN